MIHAGACIDDEAMVHPSAVVDAGAVVARGSQLWLWVHIMECVQIGENCMLAELVSIGPDSVIGNGVRMQRNAALARDSVVEDYAYIGPNCVFANARQVYAPKPGEEPPKLLPITVRKGAVIGSNVTILGGVTIGEGAVVGSGAVVTHDVQPGQTVMGVPAQVHGEHA